MLYVYIYIYIERERERERESYSMTSSYPRPNLSTTCPITQLSLGSCQARVWQMTIPGVLAAKLPNPSLAAAKPESASCQTRVWQLPNPMSAAAQLPSPSYAAAARRRAPVKEVPSSKHK